MQGLASIVRFEFFVSVFAGAIGCGASALDERQEGTKGDAETDVTHDTGSPAPSSAPRPAPDTRAPHPDPNPTATAPETRRDPPATRAPDTVVQIAAGASGGLWARFASGRVGHRVDDATEWTMLPGLDDAVQVAAAYDHACARRASGVVSCWDAWSDEDISSSVGVTFFSDVVDVATSDYHTQTCVVRASGSVACSRFDESIITIPGIDDALQLAVTANRACALRASGSVTCWGPGPTQALGDVPVTIPGVDDAIQISMADSTRTCAVRENGTVVCWDAELFDAIVANDLAAIDGLTDAIQVSAASSITVAVRSDGSLWPAHSLDDSSLCTDPNWTDIHDAVQIAASGGFWSQNRACVLRSDGTIACFTQSGGCY